MSYQEFRQSPFYQLPNQWFRVTMECRDELTAAIVQWEPSNMRWYYAEPYEGRSECGSYDVIRLENKDWKIVEIRPL